MGSVIPVFAAIFMILGSVGALFSAFFGVFMVTSGGTVMLHLII